MCLYVYAALQVKYKQKYEKEKGHYVPVKDTPQILHAKAVRTLASEVNVNHFTLFQFTYLFIFYILNRAVELLLTALFF